MTSKTQPGLSAFSGRTSTARHTRPINAKRALLTASLIAGMLSTAPTMAQEASATDPLRQPPEVAIDRYERAEEIWRQMLPPSIEPWSTDAPSQGSMATTLSRLAFENAFVQLWTRPALSLRDRSLVTISMLVAQGSEKELELHVASGLRNGLTPEEIEEVIYQATAYASFPRASQAAGIVGRVLAQERQDKESE